jgi:hypothetical protein
MEATEPTEWIVSFDGKLTEEGWAALEAASIPRTDQGPPTGVAAVSVEARSSTHAELSVSAALEALDDPPPIRSHPAPGEVPPEAEEAYGRYVASFGGLEGHPPAQAMLRWALATYGLPPEDLRSEQEVMHWVLLACYGGPSMRHVPEVMDRHRSVAGEQGEEFARRWPAADPGGEERAGTSS